MININLYYVWTSRRKEEQRRWKKRISLHTEDVSGYSKTWKQFIKKFRHLSLFHLHPSRYKIQKLKVQIHYSIVYIICYLINLNERKLYQIFIHSVSPYATSTIFHAKMQTLGNEASSDMRYSSSFLHSWPSSKFLQFCKYAVFFKPAYSGTFCPIWLANPNSSCKPSLVLPLENPPDSSPVALVAANGNFPQ